VSGNG